MKKDAKAVLDASAVLALIQAEPGADNLRPLLAQAVVCTVNVAEVLAKLVRDGMPGPEAAAALAALHIEEVGFDRVDAQKSASYVARGISLGDRCFLAVAARFGEGFSSDREVVARGSGIPHLQNFR